MDIIDKKKKRFFFYEDRIKQKRITQLICESNFVFDKPCEKVKNSQFRF